MKNSIRVLFVKGKEFKDPISQPISMEQIQYLIKEIFFTPGKKMFVFLDEPTEEIIEKTSSNDLSWFREDNACLFDVKERQVTPTTVDFNSEDYETIAFIFTNGFKVIQQQFNSGCALEHIVFDWLPEKIGVTKALRDEYYEVSVNTEFDVNSKFLLADIGDSAMANKLSVSKITQKASLPTTLKVFLTHFFNTQAVLNWEMSPTFLVTTETRILKSLKISLVIDPNNTYVLAGDSDTLNGLLGLLDGSSGLLSSMGIRRPLSTNKRIREVEEAVLFEAISELIKVEIN